MGTPEQDAATAAGRMQQIDQMEAAHMERFATGPLYRQAKQEGWADQLDAYARATIRYQAHLLTRKHPRDESPSVDYDAVLGRGSINAIGRGDGSVKYALEQWKRLQHANSIHGGISVQVPQDDIKRLVADAIAQQNLDASASESVADHA